MPSIEDIHAWYSSTDPVHGVDHVLRVYRLAQRLASAEGADLEIVCAAALLHDVQNAPAPEAETRDSHHNAAAEFAAFVLENEGWQADRILAVQHCIRAHRFRDTSEQPQTLEAQVLFDADKLDAIGAVGVARAVAYAVRAGQPIYAPPSEGFMQSGAKLPGEPHSAYHEYVFKLRKLKDCLYTAAGRSLADERHRWMGAFFDQMAAEMHGDR